MEKRNTLLQLSFVIVVLLTLGLVFMRMHGTDAAFAPSASSAPQNARRQARAALLEERQLEQLKNQEFLGLSPTQAKLLASRPGSLQGGEFSPYGEVSSLAGRRNNAAGARRAGQGAYRPGNGFSQAGGASSYSSEAGAGTNAYGNSFSAASGGYTGKNNAGGSSFGGAAAGVHGGGISGLRGVARPDAKEAMSGVLSPYLTSLTPEAAESLNKQLTGLSSRVERAILQAMLPKSRKDANIEKYLQRNSAHSASAGPFASVMEQLAAQKAGIMNSMNGAFGKEAADEAGKVMDAYQKELSAALSQPGLTAQQASQKARSIGAKYEKELQNVGQKHALKDFKEQREQKDGELGARLAKAYGPEMAAQAQEVLNAYREKDMQLALAGLPEEEYYKQQLENQRARRKELEELLIKNGKSLQGLQEAEDEMERRRVEQALKDEAEGKTLPVNHHFDDKTISATTQDLRQERREKLEVAQRIYGEAGGAEINAIYDRYEARMNEILNSDWPLSVKQQEIMNARQETNAHIAALQKTPAMRQAREREQVNSTLSQLMQDPGLQNASPQQREAFERQARPVLQDMFARINEVSESDLPDEEKQRRIAALQERAQRQLSGGQ